MRSWLPVLGGRVLWLALVAGTLAALVGLSAGSEPAPAPAADTGAHSPAEARAAAARRGARPRLGAELVERRTRTSKTFVAAGGLRVARLYSAPVHFRERGHWKPIDSRLRRARGGFVNRGNDYTTTLPVKLGARPVRVNRGRYWASMRLRGASGRAAVTNNTARYAEALPGVDLLYRAQSDSVKESLLLKHRGAQRRFVFDLGMARGLRPRVVRTQGLLLRDARRRTRLAIAAPFMVDAKGRQSPRVRFSLANIKGRWRLTVTPNRRWLDSPKRAWPVDVDPSIYPYPDRDCYLDASYPDSSFCGADFMKIGTVLGHDHTAVLHFDVHSAIPRGSDVHGASLAMKLTSQENSTWVDLKAFPLTQPWTGAASWNRRDGSERWSDPGGEADTSDPAEYNSSVGGTTTGWRYWHPFKIARDWVSGKRANHGLLIKAMSSANGGYFASSEATTSSDRPYLDVSYNERTGARRGYSFEELQLSDRIGLGVNVANGNLLVRQTDFSMPGGLGPDVAVSRAYNSLESESGAFGRGWMLDSGQDVAQHQAAGKKYMVYHGPTGVRAVYERDVSTGKYKTPPGFDNTLTLNADETWTLTDHASQAKDRFDTNTNGNRLMSEEDRNGRRVNLSYLAGNLEKITDSNGDSVSFVHASRTQLTSMTDPAARSYLYAYDLNGRLSSYTDPASGVTRYEYNGPGGKLSKITTPGGRITTIEYYPVGHAHANRVKQVTRVTNTTAMTGPTWTFEYQMRRDGSGETEVTDPNGVQSSDANDRITRYVYDEQSRVTKTIDAYGRETSAKLTSTSKVQSYTAASNTGTTPNTSFTYDSNDNLSGSATPVGSKGDITSSAQFGNSSDAGSVGTDIQGYQWLPWSSTNSRAQRTFMSYKSPDGSDTKGNLYSLQSELSSQKTVSMDYTPAASAVDGKTGQLNGITDARGNRTSYAYDTKGNLTTITPPLPLGTTKITYVAGLDIPKTVTDGKAKQRTLDYDALDRVKKITYSDGSFVEFTYDLDGNLTKEADSVGGTTTYAYDDLGRLTGETLPGGASNTYGYDLVGNLVSLTDPGGKVEYTYDALNQIRAVYEPGTSKPTKFDHNKDGLRTKTTYPNGVVIDNSYDEAFRLELIDSRKSGASSALQRFRYSYQEPSTGRQTDLRASATDEVANKKTSYVYDALDRLRQAKTISLADSSVLEQYDYLLDGAGNRLKQTIAGSQVTNKVTSYGYNAANQLCWKIDTDTNPTETSNCPTTPTGAQVPTYDANGNETNDGSGRAATYNLRDQTTALNISGTTTNLAYLGAGQDRRTTEGTVGFQHNVLGLGKAGSTYYTRDDAGTPVSRRNGTARHYYLFDALGSITGLTDATGTLSRTYEYEPYGRTARTSSPNASNLTDQLRFAGGYQGTGELYHFGQRYYDPYIGRWTQMDPLNQPDDLRQANRYTYVGGDPINLVDPEGTWAKTRGTPSGSGTSSSGWWGEIKKRAARTRDAVGVKINDARSRTVNSKEDEPGLYDGLKRAADSVGQEIADWLFKR